MVTLSSTRIASEYCQVSVGGDVAALKGIMKLVLEAHDAAPRRRGTSVLDLEFIDEHTHGFEAFAEDLRRTAWEDILRVSGLTRDQLERVAAIYMKRESGDRLLRHGHHPASSRLRKTSSRSPICCCCAATSAGRAPASARCAVTPTCRATERWASTRSPSPHFSIRSKRCSGSSRHRRTGHAVVDAIGAMIDGTAKVFIGLGGNFVAAVPDKPITEAAMRRLRLTVGITTKLNRGHLVHGEQALILPCLARSDIDIQANGRQAITVEDSMSMVHASSGLVHPPSDTAQIRSRDRLRHRQSDLAGGRPRLVGVRSRLRS